MKRKMGLVVFISLVLLLLPIGIHFIFAHFTDVNLKYKDFFMFYGSFVGGIIGVIGAFTVIYFQLNVEKKKEKLNKLDSYLKTSYVILPKLTELLLLLNDGKSKRHEKSLINEMHNHLCSESNFQSSAEQKTYIEIDKSLNEIKHMRGTFVSIKTSLDQINDDYILLDIYKEYKDLIDVLDDIVHFIDNFLENDFVLEKLNDEDNGDRYYQQYLIDEEYKFVEPILQIQFKFKDFHEKKLVDKNELEKELGISK